MGKTVPPYRIALDKEIRKWRGFARALRKEEKTAFSQMIDQCRNLASAGGNATRPIVFESVVMSILLSQQKTLNRIEKELDAIRKQCHQF